MVGAIVGAFLRERLGHDRPPLGLGERPQPVVERRLAETDHRDVAGAPPDVHPIDVDVGGEAPGRHRRVPSQVLRAEQPLLLGPDRGEEDGAPWALRERSERLGDGEDRRQPRGVVEGAVVDRRGIPLRAGLHPEVVVVSGVQDRLAGHGGVAPGQPADDVRALPALDPALQARCSSAPRGAPGESAGPPPPTAARRGCTRRAEQCADSPPRWSRPRPEAPAPPRRAGRTARRSRSSGPRTSRSRPTGWCG